MDDVVLDTAPVETRVENGIGRITLNRPKALNALTKDMCIQMYDALRRWMANDAVRIVMIDHEEGTRGFCAGGDIRRVAQSGRGDGREAAEFFAAEYRLNALIKRYPKPYLAVMDGITMGGGVGISVHGSHRIATERTVFAMPETGIGLFPDIGGGWFLPRLNGELGTWLALTGAQLKGADVLAAGIATHYVEDVSGMKAAVLAGDFSVDAAARLNALIERFSRAAPKASYAEHMEIINRCFGKDTMTDIVIALKMDDSEWAQDQADILARRSPLSMSVSLRALREGRDTLTFEDNMRMEYRIACRITRSHDFLEGVRAVLEDKDYSPHWDPISLCHVKPDMVDDMFAPLADQALELTFN
ncbi:MAG: enoyl-CoA hydratase/isomerase family protein [Asticcacaulis sp.]